MLVYCISTVFLQHFINSRRCATGPSWYHSLQTSRKLGAHLWHVKMWASRSGHMTATPVPAPPCSSCEETERRTCSSWSAGRTAETPTGEWVRHLIIDEDKPIAMNYMNSKYRKRFSDSFLSARTVTHVFTARRDSRHVVHKMLWHINTGWKPDLSPLLKVIKGY